MQIESPRKLIVDGCGSPNSILDNLIGWCCNIAGTGRNISWPKIWVSQDEMIWRMGLYQLHQRWIHCLGGA